jgi:hypothetical protein
LDDEMIASGSSRLGGTVARAGFRPGGVNFFELHQWQQAECSGLPSPACRRSGAQSQTGVYIFQVRNGVDPAVDAVSTLRLHLQ